MRSGLFNWFRSYFYPVRIRSAATAVNPVLDLYYYRGRWQLATADALYSDGIKYRPLSAAFKKLKRSLPAVNTVLVLGTGLASAVHLLQRQGYHPVYTLVELDSIVLRWALELLPADTAARVKPVCADAGQFLERDTEKYDLLIVDVFTGRHVPAFVLSDHFLQLCKDHLSPHGHLILNYMVNSATDKDRAKNALNTFFTQVDECAFDINRVYIAGC